MCENALSVTVDTEIKIGLLTLVCRLSAVWPRGEGRWASADTDSPSLHLCALRNWASICSCGILCYLTHLWSIRLRYVLDPILSTIWQLVFFFVFFFYCILFYFKLPFIFLKGSLFPPWSQLITIVKVSCTKNILI